ncbi:MAG: CDP-alcohol phosphatidyltransferase family protein [Bacteroidota bacterium]
MALDREIRSFTAPLEARVLPALARRLPRWVTPDHLTALALLAAVMGGVAYALAGRDLLWLHLASVAWVVHWIGDSLDGTLARERHIQRERYGFFVDHSADAVAAWLFLGGMAVSGLARPWLVLLVLGAYLAHMLHAAQVGLARGRYVLAPIGRVGPTEVRLVLIGANTLVWATGNPTFSASGPRWTLLDGLLGLAGGLLLIGWLVVLAVETRRLSREDPRPEPRRPDAPSPPEAPGRTTASPPASGPA